MSTTAVAGTAVALQVYLATRFSPNGGEPSVCVCVRASVCAGGSILVAWPVLKVFVPDRGRVHRQSVQVQ